MNSPTIGDNSLELKNQERLLQIVKYLLIISIIILLIFIFIVTNGNNINTKDFFAWFTLAAVGGFLISAAILASVLLKSYRISGNLSTLKCLSISVGLCVVAGIGMTSLIIAKNNMKIVLKDTT